MGKLILMSILLFLMYGSLLGQKVYNYHFEEYNSTFTEVDLLIGKKYEVNDSCYFLFKFYDYKKAMINKTEYCNDKEGKTSTYFVPKKTKKIKYTTYSQEPPYQPMTVKKRVYWFMDIFPAP